MRRAIVLVLMGVFASYVQADPKVVKLFKQVDPAVVVLQTQGREVAISEEGARRVSARGLGSGVLIDNQGHVVTAAHVVQTADRVKAEFGDGQSFVARVIASDPRVDLALLQLEEIPVGISPVKLADSDKVEVGEQVFVIGAPFGLSHSLTVGHISGRHTMEDDSLGTVRPEVFQTDTAVNQGNSGGPMFNMKGEVVGIVSYILTQSGGFEGIGFVVTSNTAQQALFVNPLFWSGLEGVAIQGKLAKALNLPAKTGYLVQKVADGSVGKKLGLEPGTVPVTIAGRSLLLGGDIITSVGGLPFTEENLPEIRQRMSGLGDNDQVRIEFIRAGRLVVRETRIGE